MGYRATTIDEQIRLLQTRGMEFDFPLDEEKAREILLDIGYYRLGFYWFHFEKKGNHYFEKGTKFSNVVKLYYLDIDLKSILSKALNRIEIHFRTQLIYTVSTCYKDNPTWFTSTKVMSKDFVQNFDKMCYTSNFKKWNLVIRKHHQKYPNHIYAPAWKTLEFLTFGTIEKIYNSLNNSEVQLSIAGKYGINRIDVFKNYLKTVVFIRNICAHSGILFDSNTRHGIMLTSLIKFNNNNRHSLDTSMKVILHFVGQISKNRQLELREEIISLFERESENQIIKNIIEICIGYKKEVR